MVSEGRSARTNSVFNRRFKIIETKKKSSSNFKLLSSLCLADFPRRITMFLHIFSMHLLYPY